MSYCCPSCKSEHELWEEVEVPGWRSVESDLTVTNDRDVEWSDALGTSLYGCSCGWGPRSKDHLEVVQPLGTDGEPLVPVHPEQMALDG